MWFFSTERENGALSRPRFLSFRNDRMISCRRFETHQASDLSKACARHEINKAMNRSTTAHRYAFPNLRFHVTATVDFFAAMYFLIARRLFCLLRLCQFFRASCFTLVLLVRGLSADGSSVRRRLATPSFQSCYFFPLSAERQRPTLLRQSPNSVQHARNSDRLFDFSCGLRANQLSNTQNHSCMKFLAEDFNSLKHITCFSMMNYEVANSFSPSPQQSLHRRKAI